MSNRRPPTDQIYDAVREHLERAHKRHESPEPFYLGEINTEHGWMHIYALPPLLAAPKFIGKAGGAR